MALAHYKVDQKLKSKFRRGCATTWGSTAVPKGSQYALIFSSIKVISLLDVATEESWWRGAAPLPGPVAASGPLLLLKLDSSLKSRMFGVDLGRSFGVGGHSWNGKRSWSTKPRRHETKSLQWRCKKNEQTDQFRSDLDQKTSWSRMNGSWLRSSVQPKHQWASPVRPQQFIFLFFVRFQAVEVSKRWIGKSGSVNVLLGTLKFTDFKLGH